jgi:RNA 3'-terminal phosphate cyclase (ATP)
LVLSSNICGGSLTGAQLKSSEISFVPKSLSPEELVERTIVGDCITAGSICLLLQIALPCALLGTSSPCKLVLKGGTNATLAPQYDYWERVFWPLVSRFGFASDQVQATVMRRGYFPRGGGEVQVDIKPFPQRLQSIQLLDRGQVSRVYIRAFHAGKLPRRLAHEMADEARSFLQPRMPNVSEWTVDVVTEKSAVGSCIGILIVATTTTECLLAGSALGTPKKSAKQVGLDAAQELWSTLEDGGCVDEWSQDQLVLYMSLAEGTSEILTGSLTLHTQTAIMIAQELSGATFQVERVSGDEPAAASNEYGSKGRIPGKHLIRCHGIGHKHNEG